MLMSDVALNLVDFFFAPALMGGVAIGLAIYFLALPLITKKTFRLEVSTTLVPVDDPGAVLDPEGDGYQRDATSQLVSLGFEQVCFASMPRSNPNTRAWIKLLVHHQTQDTACVEVFDVDPGDGKWKLHSCCVEFGTSYANGTEVITGNQQVISVWPSRASVLLSIFPGQNNLAWLYRAHNAICRWHAPGRTKRMDLYSKHDGDAIEYLKDDMNREHLPALEAGYLYQRDSDQQQEASSAVNPYAPTTPEVVPPQFGATWKGAYLMTWRLLWPIGRIIKRRFVRACQRRLKEAGFVEPGDG